MKHESLLSLKEMLCLKQSLLAPAVICLRTSAGANKHICSAQLWRNKKKKKIRLQSDQMKPFTQKQWRKLTNPSIYMYVQTTSSAEDHGKKKIKIKE